MLKSPEVEALLEATVDAVVMINHRGHIETFNRAAERLLGYQAAEVIGRNVSMLMTARDSDLHDEYMRRYERSGVPHIIGIGREVDVRRKDGTVFPAFLSVGRIPGSSPARYVGYLHDISLRRETLEAARRERDRANNYLNLAQVVLVALLPDATVQLVNRRGIEVLGRSEGSLVGQNWLQSAVAPSDHALAAESLRKLAQPLHDAELYCEYHLVGAQGMKRLIAWRGVGLRDAGGGIAGFLLSGEDVTDARIAEQASHAAQARLAQVSRLATLGELTAGIAHEINQPLAAISNFASAASRMLAAPNSDMRDVRAALDAISTQAVRAGEIIRRLRGLSQNRETRRDQRSAGLRRGRCAPQRRRASEPAAGRAADRLYRPHPGPAGRAQPDSQLHRGAADGAAPEPQGMGAHRH
jgi:two-component system sensor kinase FixL